MHWGLEVDMPFLTKEKRWVGVWNFKGKVTNSQVAKKEKTCDKQILTGLPRNNGTEEC